MLASRLADSGPTLHPGIASPRRLEAIDFSVACYFLLESPVCYTYGVLSSVVRYIHYMHWRLHYTRHHEHQSHIRRTRRSWQWVNWNMHTGSFVDFSWLPITETPRMAQHCGPTAALAVVSRDPTFAPWTPATSPENNHRVHLSLVCPRRGLVTRACVREGGKCPVPGAADRWLADRTEPAPRPPCQQTHTGFSLSRLGRVAVPGALSHARHLTCKCVHL